MADKSNQLDIDSIITDVLNTIEREREREIVSRRFGLYDRKETLEQIGELLGITRERVRQLEKAILTRLRVQAEQGQLPHMVEVQQLLIDQVTSLGNVARISDLSQKVLNASTRTDQSKVSFLATLCPELAMVDENDFFYLSVGVRKIHDEKKIKDLVGKIIEAVKKIGKPTTIEEIAETAGQRFRAL
jgi:hypothetical protein